MNQSKTVAAIICIGMGLSMFVQPAGADDFFEEKVAPILQKRCAVCHNDADMQGDFSIRTRESVLESGFVEPGDARGSLLYELITPQDGEPPEMPKTGAALSAEEIKTIKKWINDGASWREKYFIEPAEKNFDWWSFKPMQKSAVPTFETPEDQSWGRTPIDAFILAKLKQRGLSPSGPANKRTLIRRVTYDLTGLPPTFAEIEAFLKDDSPNAYEKLVDRLLASPRYGEHWARHWLDVVKYADTCGYDKDKLRPNAWPYRDYVIRSFNNDKPYRQFVREQIAGDVFYPGQPDGILGLGFIAAGPWDFIGHVEVPESKIDGMVARNLDRDEMVTNTINTFSSLTIQCARCHDHKFDPFTQEQYYGLQAVFAAVDRAERVYDDSDNKSLRIKLNQQLDSARKATQKIKQQLRKKLGDRLVKLDAKISELEKSKSAKRPEFGYHSQGAGKPDTEKWVEVDLGSVTQVSKIILNPCHDEFGGIGAGFGFPVRFKVIADEETILDHSQDDYANPKLKPIAIDVERKVRRVKVVANRLFNRNGLFIFALAELQVLDSDGKNLALGKDVKGRDSIEAPIRWRQTNLVDGIWFAPQQQQKRNEQLQQLKNQRQQMLVDTVGQKLIDELNAAQESIVSTSKQLKELPRGKVVYAAATKFKPQGQFKSTGGKPRVVKNLIRGNVQTPGDEVKPGALPLDETSGWTFAMHGDESESARRASLARWLTTDEHPLLWRSIVNRVWHYHFGRGIVDTPNDFGRMGGEPTHLELLDWLAVKFRDSGGSFKELHRSIVDQFCLPTNFHVQPERGDY